MQTCHPVSPSPPRGIRRVTVELLDVLSGELSPPKTSSSQLPAPSHQHPSLLSPQSFLQTMVTPVQPLPQIDSEHWGLVMPITAPEGTVLRHKAGCPVQSPGGLVDSRWPQPLQEKSRCLRERGEGCLLRLVCGSPGEPRSLTPGRLVIRRGAGRTGGGVKARPWGGDGSGGGTGRAGSKPVVREESGTCGERPGQLQMQRVPRGRLTPR